MAEGDPIFKPVADVFRAFSSISADKRSEIEQVLGRIEADEASEAQGLETYRQAAEASKDEGVRFLMSMILEDEERHRRLLHAMARDIRQSLEWSREGRPLPNIHPSVGDSAALLDQAEHFLDVERDNLRDLRGLRHSVRDLEAGLLDLIVGTMEDDTKKHIEILEFIRRRLRSGR